MYVDPRVAHGVAKLRLTSDPGERDRQIHAVTRAISDALMELMRRNMSTRDAQRHLKRTLIPALLRIPVTAALSLDPRAGILVVTAYAVVKTADGQESIEFQAFSHKPRNINVRPWFMFTPHAIARCHERNGTTEYCDIEQELSVAYQLTPLIFNLCRENGWRQAFVPTSEGIFVGDFDGTIVTMRTYIRPGANDRASKWQWLLDALPLRPGEIHSMKEAIELQRIFTRWLEDNGTRLAERFPFVLQPYEAKGDPRDARWNAARNAADRKSESLQPNRG